MSDPEDVAWPEKALLSALDEMLSLPGFLFPLVTAQRQYRNHYYGLSSAALLEDLFFDAFANYLAQYRPATAFERPGRGQKGWDYRFEGLEVSHKVGLKPQAIAVLWDATVKATHWTCDFPVAYLCSGYEPGVSAMTWRGLDFPVKPLSGSPTEVIGRGHRVWLLNWPATGRAQVLWHVQAHEKTTVADLLPFDVLWPLVASYINVGFRANRIEVVRSNRPVAEPLEPFGDDPAELSFTHRSGVSLFVASDLVNVPVESNNRALLLSRDTVAQKMVAALGRGLFVPMPLWFRIFAADRPPDLYLTQRAEFDSLFSPASRPPPEVTP